VGSNNSSVISKYQSRRHTARAEHLVAPVQNGDVPRRRHDVGREAEHEAHVIDRDDTREHEIRALYLPRRAELQHVKARAGQHVPQIDAPSRRDVFDNEHAHRAAAGRVQIRGVEWGQVVGRHTPPRHGKRLRGPIVGGLVDVCIGHEFEYEPRRERRLEFGRAGDVLGHRLVVPEVLPRVVRQRLAPRRDRELEHALDDACLRVAKPSASGFLLLDARDAAVLVLAAAAARTRIVAAGRRRRHQCAFYARRTLAARRTAP
jgi:hypothetical protein